MTRTDLFPALDPELLAKRLDPPTSKVRLLIDTDTANEIDDQFALAWALLSPEHMTVEAVTTEPFSFAHHREELIKAEQAIKSGDKTQEHLVGGFQGWLNRLHKQGKQAEEVKFVSPAEGMELSYQEILTVYEKMAIAADGKVFRGAKEYMSTAFEPVKSDSVDAIIDLAKSGSDPLYIAAMGCVTNIASALLLAPEIRENIVVIWTSAYPSSAPHSNRASLNLVQDVHASRLMFDSGVPLVYLPGYHVGAQLKISLPEIEQFVAGNNAIGDYLHHLYTNNPLHTMFALEDTARRTWVLWDVIDIAWLINPAWVPTLVKPAPILDEDLYWLKNDRRHMIREGYDVQRDEIFLDFYDKLANLK